MHSKVCIVTGAASGIGAVTAQALAQQKQLDEAVDVAAKIPERFPNFAEAHEVDYLIGRAKAAQADFAAARDGDRDLLESLDDDHRELMARLASKTLWPRGEFLAVCEELSVLPDPSIELINSWAFVTGGLPLIEDGDPLFVDMELLREIFVGDNPGKESGMRTGGMKE